MNTYHSVDLTPESLGALTQGAVIRTFGMTHLEYVGGLP